MVHTLVVTLLTHLPYVTEYTLCTLTSTVSTRYATLCATLVSKHVKTKQVKNDRLEVHMITYLRYKKITHVKNTSHSALRPKYPSKTNAATPSPDRSSPRPRVNLFIVVLLRLATAVRSNSPARSQIATSILPPPPPKNSTKILF